VTTLAIIKHDQFLLSSSQNQIVKVQNEIASRIAECRALSLQARYLITQGQKIRKEALMTRNETEELRVISHQVRENLITIRMRICKNRELLTELMCERFAML